MTCEGDKDLSDCVSGRLVGTSEVVSLLLDEGTKFSW